MSVCTFFGHSECYGLDAAVLRNTIEDLIKQGTTEFLVGNHGHSFYPEGQEIGPAKFAIECRNRIAGYQPW